METMEIVFQILDRMLTVMADRGLLTEEDAMELAALLLKR
jgi:hypothetical protein